MKNSMHKSVDKRIVIAALLLIAGALAVAQGSKSERKNQALFKAAQSGTAKKINSAIKKGADVNARTEGGATALMLAAQYNTNSDVIIVLLGGGADVSTEDNSGNTALIYAVKSNNNPDVIKVLVSAWADANVQDKDDGTGRVYSNTERALHNLEAQQSALQSALQSAKNDGIMREYSNAEQVLLDLEAQHSSLLSKRQSEVNEELISACQQGKVFDMRAAMDNGANVNARAWGSNKPVLVDIAGRPHFKAKLDVITLLLTWGADVNAVDGYGQTALMHFVSEKGYFSSADMDLNILKALIDAGANVNAQTKNGGSALIYAANNPHFDMIDVIEILIDAGADVNMKNKEGVTVLMRTVAGNKANPKMIKVLIDAGADVNARDNGSHTVLMYAAQFNTNPDVIAALIDAGADINARDDTGVRVRAYLDYNEKLGTGFAYRKMKELLQ